jgi:hypothetical protein
MARRKITAKEDFRRQPDSEIVTRGTNLVQNLEGNPHFPNPPVSLAVFKAVLDRLMELMAEALDGSRKVIAEKNKQREEAIKLMRMLTGYVVFACHGDEAIFKTSGLELAYATRRPTQHLSEAIRRIEYGGVSGRLLIFVNDDPEAGSYQLQYGPMSEGEPPLEWTSVNFTNVKSPRVLDGLTPGRRYAFQIRKVKDTGYTDWSDSVTFMCT